VSVLYRLSRVDACDRVDNSQADSSTEVSRSGLMVNVLSGGVTVSLVNEIGLLSSETSRFCVVWTAKGC